MGFVVLDDFELEDRLVSVVGDGRTPPEDGQILDDDEAPADNSACERLSSSLLVEELAEFAADGEVDSLDEGEIVKDGDGVSSREDAAVEEP